MKYPREVQAACVIACGIWAASCSSSGKTQEPEAPARPAIVVLVPPSIPYKSDEAAPASIRTECDFDRKMPAYMVQEGEGKVQLEQAGAVPERYRKLTLVIQTLHSLGGGAYTGPKWLVIEGALTEKGQVIGSFEARRQTIGSSWTTCGVLKSLSEDVADDILKWLDEPSKNAKLGDAQ